jgi:hypothetical protein
LSKRECRTDDKKEQDKEALHRVWVLNAENTSREAPFENSDPPDSFTSYPFTPTPAN